MDELISEQVNAFPIALEMIDNGMDAGVDQHKYREGRCVDHESERDKGHNRPHDRVTHESCNESTPLFRDALLGLVDIGAVFSELLGHSNTFLIVRDVDYVVDDSLAELVQGTDAVVDLFVPPALTFELLEVALDLEYEIGNQVKAYTYPDQVTDLM